MKLPLILSAFFLSSLATSAEQGDTASPPDLTKGEVIPADAKHDWNLGATGARGWIFCNKLVTSDARQIAITQVEEKSPSDGILAVGDVILGVGGKAFSHDPRTEFGKALSVAESEAGGGKLTLIRWRAGKSGEVILTLPVFGSYSAAAPYDCPKSKRILEEGCRALAARMADPDYLKGPTGEPITRSLNALALLASGNPDYLTLIKKEAEWAAAFSADNMQSWRYGYLMMLLAEYLMATGDETVLPGLQRLALETAKGQSGVGSWGHKFAKPDGRLYGYGMMNSPGIPLTIGLVMSRAAGVKDPAIDLAIERSARLLRFYIGKGAIPYGDHHPWILNHEDNGKCGMASVLFHLLGEPAGTEFFSRMSLASHGPERDTGHTGNFFNMIWAMPGVAHSGPQATGAWMEEFGAWYFDLARRPDGSFFHQGPPEPRNDSYAGWDCTGAYLLAYAMPLKKIYLTGKRASAVPPLDSDAAQSVILDGRGWNNKDRDTVHEAMSDEQLLERLRNWSPVVRERAAIAMGRRKEAPVERVIAMLAAPDLEARYGACQALIFLRGRGAPAVAALRNTLQEDDLWLRVKAAEALAAIGAPAMEAVPQLLELLTRDDSEKDPRAMQQRYLTFALFDTRDGMLGRSLEGVDREALYRAVRAGLKNQDGRARGSLGSVYKHLSLEEISPLLPAILQAITDPAPSGEMFADSIRVEGLRLLAEHHIEEGMGALVQYTRDQNPWASQKRTPELMTILLSYGSHAKVVIPELEKLAHYFEKEEKDFPPKLMLEKATSIRDTIRAIEASTEAPTLLKLGETK
jgi:HEAT repeat protein